MTKNPLVSGDLIFDQTAKHGSPPLMKIIILHPLHLFRRHENINSCKVLWSSILVNVKSWIFYLCYTRDTQRKGNDSEKQNKEGRKF